MMSQSVKMHGAHLVLLSAVVWQCTSQAYDGDVVNSDSSDVETGTSLPHGKAGEIYLGRKGRVRVGIVGSGLGGMASAAFLRALCPNVGDIVMYEEGRDVCGRIDDIVVEGHVVEVGVPSFTSNSPYINQWVEDLGLSMAKKPATSRGIWNGVEFTVKTTSVPFLSYIQELWSYGLGVSTIYEYIEATKATLDSVYELVENQAFKSVADLTAELSANVSSMWEYLVQHGGVPAQVVADFLGPIVRGQTGLDPALVNSQHALHSLWAETSHILEGNRRICEGIVNLAQVELHRYARVVAINQTTPKSAAEDGAGSAEYVVQTSTISGQQLDAFDAVIIAAPMGDPEIQLKLADDSSNREEELRKDKATIEYQSTHVTLVAGELDPTWFGCGSLSCVPSAIYTTHDSNAKFFALQEEAVLENERRLYKFLSHEELPDSYVEQFFVSITTTFRVEWDSIIPRLNKESRQNFSLDGEGLVYLNAMESFVSSLEMTVIAARNGVQLLAEAGVCKTAL